MRACVGDRVNKGEWTYQRAGSEEGAALRRRLGLREDRPLVLVCPNVPWTRLLPGIVPCLALPMNLDEQELRHELLGLSIAGFDESGRPVARLDFGALLEAVGIDPFMADARAHSMRHNGFEVAQRGGA
jgi:hypothetical protein